MEELEAKVDALAARLGAAGPAGRGGPGGSGGGGGGGAGDESLLEHLRRRAKMAATPSPSAVGAGTGGGRTRDRRASVGSGQQGVKGRPGAGAGATPPQSPAKPARESATGTVGALAAADSANDIMDFARVLGLDIVREAELLWVAEEFWLCPLPEGWEECCTPEGLAFYHFIRLGVTQWEHPLEGYYRGVVFMLKGGRQLLERSHIENPPTAEEAADMADYFDVDLEEEPHLESCVKMAVGAPLPPGWVETAEGAFKDSEGRTSESHPLDEYFLELISREQHRKRKVEINGRQATQKQIALVQAILARVQESGGKDPDPYLLLSLERGASKQDTRARYRELSLLVHPDKNPIDGATAAFKALTQAYKQVISGK